MHQGEETPVDGTIKVFVPPEAMEAYISISPPRAGGQPVTFELAMKALKSAGVLEGIKPAAINEALAIDSEEQLILIAQGVPARDGKDSRLHYHFSPPEERIKPTELNDGTVDYKNLNFFYNVRRGDILVTRTPCQPGIPGITVTGRSIPPKPGKQVPMPRGKNTEMDNSGQFLFASRDGHVSIVKGKVDILPIFEVNGNVDYSVGNIDFWGSLIIKGSVLSGFTVKAEGDIEVGGVIEAARIQAGGNVLVRNGVIGSGKAKIKAAGSIFSRFVENATLEAGVDIVVGNSIVQSVVRADGAVKLERRKSTIVGGVVQAGQEICSSVIGSPLGVDTLLEVGILPRLRETYRTISRNYQEKKKEFDMLVQQMEVQSKLIKCARSGITNKHNAVLNNLQEQYQALSNEVQKLKQSREQMIKLFEQYPPGKVRVQNIVYPGTRIVINQAVYDITDSIQYALFFLKEDEVRFESLR